MTLTCKNIEIPAAEGANPDLRSILARYLDLDVGEISAVRLVKKSLDARKKRHIVYRLQLDFEAQDEVRLLQLMSSKVEKAPERTLGDPLEGIDLKNCRFSQQPVIVGSGPAGLFAALILALAGKSAVILERGEGLGKRLRAVNRLRQKGVFDPESHYCFGEGGAGTFSDGKLTCGRNHPMIRFIFHQLVAFGAPQSILYDSHPHVGTDNLLRVLANLRSFLADRGTQIRFGQRFEGFRYHSEKEGRFQLVTNGQETLSTNHLVLAIGHSARDTYEILHQAKVAMIPKPFAIGARIEHPQKDIDQIQFGSCQLLPPAEYKLAARADGRGIWTFCMCPGGILLPTSAQEGHLAINGMSYYARNSGFANAAVVVNVLKEDFYRGHPLDGMFYQSDLEKKAFVAGGGGYHSPAQNLLDFVSGRPTKTAFDTTYQPGVVSARMDKLLPPVVVEALKSALTDYNRRMRGFLSDQAAIIGLESKTSAPVSFPRNEFLESISHPGLYPTGEGAGFAGGIVSAALDGIRVGKALLRQASLS